MDDFFVAILSTLLIAALIPLYLWKRHRDSQSSSSSSSTEEAHQAPVREPAARATATRRMRRRTVASGASSSSAPPATQQESGDESDNEAAGDEQEAKASKKKELKRQEREARRQAEEARQSKQDRYSEMRRLKDEEREAQERKLEEEAKAQKAREEEAAALEFDKWKGEFSVDDEGTLEEEQDKTEDLLTNFVEYIKKQKCVPLEDLAAEFKLRTQECINRITSLESMGRLSGVMDDRGKFIYISQEEMKAVADYIKRQGRVSISHLASKSNQFIDLEPKTHYTEDISNMEEITVN
ncbi:putative DDRGK domain containing protein [Medicago truncatula]|uniref:DDRGK domain-containing protein 1 n=1 Tax=Medicago truncatula TaxID=3880 RepID=G7IJN2_MEDTR|nr:DDRGK domain-containing protein 1 [Medicago truncatula]AES66902.1 DDRGK domain protein [Medicago truncatula]RHN75292.1 putative DDRGK domain containing protein [Medicago truncatula]